MIKALTAKNLPTPLHRYSVAIDNGSLCQLSGMIAIDVATDKLVDGGVYHETRKILHNLLASLDELRLSLDELMHATIFTTELDNFADINRAWEEVFTTDRRPPARTSVGVSQLPAGAKVEIEFRFCRFFYEAPDSHR